MHHRTGKRGTRAGESSFSVQMTLTRAESAEPGSFAGRLVRPGRRSPPVSGETLVLAAGAALACSVLAGALSRRSAVAGARHPAPADFCANRLRQGAATLGASVLVDSAIEHFRGNYENRLMYAPPALAAASIATSLGRPGPRGLQAGLFGAAALVGAAGLGLHAYNILKRPGGLSWNNLFYAAPIAAPGALALSGVLGLAARAVEASAERQDSNRSLGKLGRGVAFMLAGGLLGTVGEVALLHFRGAYHDPFMYAPITLPPLAAASLAAAGAKPSATRLKLSRILLSLTGALGAIGTAFHAYGVQRNMGGWRNWSQNLFSGPPLPAPPSFTGLSIAGLGVLRLISARR